MAGVAIAFIGYTSTFAVVLAGLRAVGASPAEATSGLVALCASLGLGTLWLSRRCRMPITLAWSTPGAAVLASAGHVAGGWQAAVGAFLVAGGLVALTGFWPRLGALVAAIPASIAQAMLAGVLLELCLVPVKALTSHPWEVAPILFTWLITVVTAPRWAIPAAFGATVIVVGFLAVRSGGLNGPWLPQLTLTAPQLTWPAIAGIALPLYVVTMAAQNVPGVAIMSSFGYQVPWRAAMGVTGLGSVLAAPFGGHAVNLAAISAALPASPQAHADPGRRWMASQAFGVTYLGIAAGTTALTSFLAVAPPEVVGTVAGLGLLGTLSYALTAAIAGSGGALSPAERTAATVTFVVAASGTTLAGVSSAFWALLAGLMVCLAFTAPPWSSEATPAADESVESA
ncbi:benzoate/H(+) symporter BenE family transporter [Nonomuraea lactucae]|uniref:benzoate/H(+) symporter BenE family transporter n=1 Tax=Nonomuraea lactucae TaxID=2249762 RepID=UPI001963D132|nr:benzoate/H(+) symporter BenE family transporter [Nonomuraea lactucae]